MSEPVVERRTDGQARELLIAQRELQLAADESWALARERASDLRDKQGDLRERRLRQRENTTLRRENKCQASEATRALLESHILKLRQANEQLVITAVQAQTMADEIRRTKDAMGHMAQHDFLTDLPNRFLLTQRLDGAIALAQRSGKHFAVLFLDLDRFKVINDSLGHAIGDAVLQEVARRLLTVIRATDTASRQGGDEFVVILSEIANEHAVCEVAGKICEAIARPYELPDGTAHIGVTIGISMYPDDGGTPETLIRKADVAMYDAKHSGRDRYHFFRLDMNARAIERVGAVIAMGNSLGQRVVAEGVEHDTQLKFLTQHHCTEGQGYYFSKPLAAADFAALVRSAH